MQSDKNALTNNTFLSLKKHISKAPRHLTDAKYISILKKKNLLLMFFNTNKTDLTFFRR